MKSMRRKKRSRGSREEMVVQKRGRQGKTSYKKEGTDGPLRLGSEESNFH